MRALDVATFGYIENLRAKQWRRFKQVCFRHCNNYTAAENNPKQRKHCKKNNPKQRKHCKKKTTLNNENTVKSTAFLLKVWKKWCLEKGIAEEIKSNKPNQLNTLLERFYAEIKNKHG